MQPWSFQNSKNWLFFSHVEKKLPKKIIFCAGLPPPPELHIRIFPFSDSYTPVHWILFYLQIHVPGYMMFCFFFKSMYPGTWNFDFSSNPCTPVHGIQIFFILLMFNSGGGGGPAQKIIFFLAIFFNMWKNQSIFGVL
mgnify:CR=1 FL=1